MPTSCLHHSEPSTGPGVTEPSPQLLPPSGTLSPNTSGTALTYPHSNQISKLTFSEQLLMYDFDDVLFYACVFLMSSTTYLLFFFFLHLYDVLNCSFIILLDSCKVSLSF
ncbi:hypothetical protein ATANTOWER_026424 [Ataeniobius toweri]|uniref:Uncharacterized protein n=1 Tax=Ataeniobius toweri TaxID=208326 RepID=A0ABU7BC31_9TELE|nr:hypothetical protein [Ataeniobius toweri]